MYRAKFVVLFVAIAIVGTGCDWTQWGANSLHTGTTGATDLAPPTVPQLTPDVLSADTATGQVVTAAGHVFVTTAGTLRAYDATTHTHGWTATLPAGSTVGSVAAIDLDPASNTIFVMVGGAQPVLVGYDVAGTRNCDATASTCNPVFVASLGAAAVPSPPVVADGRVYVNAGGAVYAFDANGTSGCTNWYGMQACSPLWSQLTGGNAPGVGPAVVNGVVFTAAGNDTGYGLAAFAEASGAPLWFGPLHDAVITATPSVATDGSVVVPTEHAIVVFPDSCAEASCRATAILTSGADDTFAATPTITTSAIYATSTNGHLYAWPAAGCGATICTPTGGAVVDAPAHGATDASQTAASENGVLFVLGRQAVASGDDVVVEALDATTLETLSTWDLGPGGLAPGLTSVSIANGVVYAPIRGAVIALSARATPVISVSPLTLSPAFSPTTTDYALACAAGANSLTVNADAAAGGSVRIVAPITTDPAPSLNESLDLAENAALVIEAASATGTTTQYWIRCLPHDFPTVTFHPHPGASAASPGWYLTGTLALGSTTYGNYAMILDNNGVPVWYKKTTPVGAIDVTSLAPNTVTYATAPAGRGYAIDPNSAFTQYNLATGTTSSIKAVNAPTDFHELLTTPNGDHIVLAYPLKRGVDLTGLGGTPAPGPNSTIADCQIQELDPQGNLVWSWTASDHIDPVTESLLPSPAVVNGETVYDVFHCNSVDVDANGNLLLSGRSLSAVYDIDRATGSIVWKLGGTANNLDGARIIHLTNYPYANLGGQHDARFLADGHIGLFDDQSFGAGPADAVEFSVDVANGTAQPTFQFTAPTGKNSVATGTFRRQPDGHRVIGWGLTATYDGSLFTELDQNGTDVLDATFPPGNGAYRVLKFPIGQFDLGVLRSTAGSANPILPT
jgi:hypothetical protein